MEVTNISPSAEDCHGLGRYGDFSLWISHEPKNWICYKASKFAAL